MEEAGLTVCLSIIGLGVRGTGQMKTILDMPDVKVRAVCDVYPVRVTRAQDIAEEKQGFRPDGETDYRKVINRTTS